MKFGKNLAIQQAKFAFLRYLNYKELKKVIKQDSVNSTCFFDLHLQAEIEAVNASFSLNVAHIQGSLLAVADNLQPSISIRLREVMRIAEQVEILRRFAVWNAVAVVKILKKRTKVFSGPTPPGLLGEMCPQVAAPTGGDDMITNGGTEQWLSKQLFFSGSDFAELQAQLESLAGELGGKRLEEISARFSPKLAQHGDDQESERCPICLEKCIDAVELSSCGHRFCWKCVVLGPIAFAPGEYRLSRCSVCRNEQPLDPTRNFKTVCSNQLHLLSQLLIDQDSSCAEEERFVWDEELVGLDILYGSAGGRKDKVESQKEQQTLDSIDAETGGIHPSTFFCSLCCEPLLLEAVTTTPCKHHFHRVCLEKHGERECPLCGEELPAKMVMGRFAQEQLMRLQQITPGILHRGGLSQISCAAHYVEYPDFPCVNCGFFSLSNLPPTVLIGLNGLETPSFIHCVDPAVLLEKIHIGPKIYYARKTGVELRGFSSALIGDKRRRATEYTTDAL